MINVTKLAPSTIHLPKGLGVRANQLYCPPTRFLQQAVTYHGGRSFEGVKCQASSPATPDASFEDESQPLPFYAIHDEVVTIDGAECRVLSPIDVSHRVGIVVFLSGFAQSTEAYKSLLERCATAGLVVLAPSTSTVSASRSRLQESLVTDSAFWTDLAIANSHPSLKALLPKRGNRVGILGHSVGGGLSYALAARFPEVKSIVTMSPFPSLSEEFDPASIIASEEFLQSQRRALVLAGRFDLYSTVHSVEGRIVEPLREAFGPDAVDFECLNWGLHTVYQDYINFPLENLTLAFLKSDAQDAVLTAMAELPGLLAGKLFLSGLRFELTVMAALFAYGVTSDNAWLKWGASSALSAALLVAVIVELIKQGTGQPKNVSERIAKFFLEM